MASNNGSSGITIHDMQKFAETMNGDGHGSGGVLSDQDIGNIINLDNNSFDDIGLNLLTNSRIKTSHGSSSQNTVNISPSFTSVDNVSIHTLEPLNPITIDIPLSTSGKEQGSIPEIKLVRESAMPSEGVRNSGGSIGIGEQTFGTAVKISIEDELKEKLDLLNKLHRLRAKGFQTGRPLTFNNSLDEIKQEFNRILDTRNLENSIKFQRQMLMGLVTGMEMMNNKFNLFDWQLNGWSESVHENVDDFDEVFEELYDKYKGKGNLPPEARLLFTLVGSGFMFHMSNSFFKTKIGNISVEDVLRSNPMLAKQMAAAAAQTASPGFGNFMGAAMGIPEVTGNNMNSNNGGVGMFSQSSHATPIPQESGRGNLSSGGSDPSNVARKEMKGPSGVDDILKTFEEVRKAETDSLRASSVQQSTAQEFAEVVAHNDDAASHHSSMMSSSNPRGRRRKHIVPEGNTVSLNV